jgi:hypothetical protein
VANLNSRAMMGWIPTSGEVLPNGVILDLVRGEESNALGLLVWSKDTSHYGPKVTYGGKTYVPAKVDPTVLAAMQLPSRSAARESPTGELFGSICELLAQYTGLPEQSLSQIAYFVFASWMADRVPIAPFLWIVAPATADGGVLLQLLSLFCRRSLLLTAESTAGLWTLPIYLRPTLLLDAAELTAPVQKFLRASSSKGIHFARRGQALNLYCAKAVCSQEPQCDPSLASFALQITLPPRRQQLHVLTQEAGQKIADEFQAALLRYRLTNYHNARPPDIDVGGLAVPTQALARSLAACIIGDEKLQSAVVPLLRDQDREIQVERSSGLESVILEALFFCCHDGDRSALRAAELAEITNTMLARRGQRLQISPETVGWKLKSLRFRTEPIGSGGRGLWLLNDVRDKIHSLAFEYGVQRNPQGQINGCTHCLKLNSETHLGGREQGQTSKDASEL